jgi:leucyl/phenylalanyl-tRNA---protein transferase
MFLRSSRDVRPELLDIVWQYAQGRMMIYLDGEGSPIGWKKFSHHGIQRLDHLYIADRIQRYLRSPKFTFRIDTAFEQALEHCSDLSRNGHTWMTSEVKQAYRSLHASGFAHSFEAWEGDKLTGGTLGMHVGAMMSLDSIFHLTSNAGKVAYAGALQHLKGRGFPIVDVNGVTDFNAQFGSETVRQWEFEEMLRRLLLESRSISDDVPAPTLPWQIRAALPVARMVNAVTRRIKPAGLLARSTEPATAASQVPQMPAPPPAPSVTAGSSAHTGGNVDGAL